MFTISNDFLLPTAVLGAADPEMVCIENALRILNVPFCFAVVDGVRVHGGNAYSPAVTVNQGIREDALFVECAVAGCKRINVADHHRPGDYGYGRDPSEFWEASSIGQVHRFLTEWSAAHPSLGWTTEVLDAAFGENRYVVAASDHCPGAAFAGKCPGVSYEALFTFRATNSAAFNGMTPDEWAAQVVVAIAALQAAPRVETPHGFYVVIEERINLLNHAQLIGSVPMQYRMDGTDRDPRTKVGLMVGDNPALVRHWMESMQGQLVDIYGDPMRGYAGGYLPA